VFGLPDDDTLAADAIVCDGPEWETAAEKGHIAVVYHPKWRRTEPGHDCCCCECGTGSGRAVSADGKVAT
jgi:hypothetical protein